jgi:hypothetical protein
MNWQQYQALEYQLNVRMAGVERDVHHQGLVYTARQHWLRMAELRQQILQAEYEAMSQMEKDMLERRRQFDKEHEEYKARLARERGRGAFGATYTGD